MTKTISTWKPWNIGTPEEVVFLAAKYGNEVAIKGTDGVVLYGMNTWTKIKWGIRQDEFADMLKAAGLKVSFWSVPYFWDWAKEVDRIKEAIEIYNPNYVYLDIERFHKSGTFRGTNVDSNGYIKNVGPFLRRLGRVVPKVLFQGPRRLTAHPEVQAEKFLGYKDLSNGKYIVDGIGAQLYPMGWKGAVKWVEQTALDLTSQETVLAKVGRPGLPYVPTLPGFLQKVAGSMWTPTGEEIIAQATFLQSELGDRLKGVNYWTLDYESEMTDAYNAIKTIPDPEVSDPPDPGVPPDLDEWVEDAEAFRRLTLDNLDLMGNYVEEIRAADPGPAPGM